MYIIGITGKSGSGKSTVAKMLSTELNCEYVDIDKIGHEIYTQPSVLEQIRTNFGDAVFDTDGNANRKKIGEIVFTDSKKMKILEDLSLGYMEHRIDSIVARAAKFVILEWILLPRSKYFNECNYKILVQATSDDIRTQQVLKRDNISQDYFEKRDNSAPVFTAADFDFILKNDYDYTHTQAQIDTIAARIRTHSCKIYKD